MIKLIPEVSDDQLAWRNHESINSWTRQNGILNEADMLGWYQKIASDPTIKMFGIENEQGINVGTMGLTSISLIHGHAEFSLLIGPEFQGNGYGKAALKELLNYGFRHLRLNYIWGESFEGNPALNMFKKLGMKEEGCHREKYFKNGVYIHAYTVSMLRKEWEKEEWSKG